jgi:phthiocerol/phenolphthiocerol synthesis type-I polyketide synthase B
LMDPILPDLRAALADLVPSMPTIPFISTVVEHTTAPVLDAEYWVANVRQPALLSQAITAAAEDHGTFIEISAHPILTHAVSDTLESVTHHHAVGTLWRDGDDTVTFHTNVNAVHTSQPREMPHPAEPAPVLPTTPWHHSKHWTTVRPSAPANRWADSAAVVQPAGLAGPYVATRAGRRRQLVAGDCRFRAWRGDRPCSRRWI